jgi:hypothetical protein
VKTLLPTFLFCLVLVLSGALFKLAYRALYPRVTPNTELDEPDSQPDPAATRADQRAKPSNSTAAAQPSGAGGSSSESSASENPFVHRRIAATANQWTNFEDATDHVAAEIFDALENRPTLAVWLFDCTESAGELRDRVARRCEWVYQTLDRIKAAGHPSFEKHAAPPLTSVIGAFGKSVEFLTGEPTDDTGKLKSALQSIREDSSGEEHTFEAIDKAVKQFGKYRASDNRLLLIVVVTDEAGDDAELLLDELVPRMRKSALPVFVIGVPAPLGLKTSVSPLVQGESFKPVHQGPESLLAEALDLGGWSGDSAPVDSGFGSFGLSRLALETGGRYLAVRPEAGYDPQLMAAYAPDYVSRAAYEGLLNANKARRALIETSRLAHIDLAGYLELNFPKKDESAMKRMLDQAQQKVARLEPKLKALAVTIMPGEAERPQLTGPRWKAGFDLAIGRVLAAQARVEGYNSALAELKQGRRFPSPDHKTWVLRPTNDIKGNSSLEKMAAKARKYLNGIVSEHPGTPWATLAERELKAPVGWEWTSR